jgi:hypothetical protein
MADNVNTDISKLVDGTINIDAEYMVELYQSMQDFKLYDSRLSEDYPFVID